MLNKILNENLINVNVNCLDWKEAIKEGTLLLEKKGYVDDNYEKAIINNFKSLGPYMVIAPGIVLSHARPDDGVKEMGISIITLKNPIHFGNKLNDPVKLVITLAAKDNVSHIEILKSLMNLLMDSEDINNLINSSTKNEVLDIIKKY